MVVVGGLARMRRNTRGKGNSMRGNAYLHILDLLHLLLSTYHYIDIDYILLVPLTTKMTPLALQNLHEVHEHDETLVVKTIPPRCKLEIKVI